MKGVSPFLFSPKACAVFTVARATHGHCLCKDVSLQAAQRGSYIVPFGEVNGILTALCSWKGHAHLCKRPPILPATMNTDFDALSQFAGENSRFVAWTSPSVFTDPAGTEDGFTPRDGTR